MEEKITFAGNFLNKIINFGFEYSPKIIGGIIVLLIGLWITKLITKSVGKALAKSKLDQSLVPFLKSLTSIILKILVIITVMGMIGIQMTSFIAIIGAAGFAVGLALSGTLQNFAVGVILVILKLFKVGACIEAQGCLGTVKGIRMFEFLFNT